MGNRDSQQSRTSIIRHDNKRNVRRDANKRPQPIEKHTVSDWNESDDEKDINDEPTAFEIKPIESGRRNFNPFMTNIRINNNNNNNNDTDNNDTDNMGNMGMIGSFEFGELFDYWQHKKSSIKIFVAAQYKTLKEEIINNKNDKYLSEEQWNDFMKKAKNIQQRMYENKDNDWAIYAKYKPYFNKLFNIKYGSPLSIDHIMAIILYSDTDDLQKYFKEQTRKMNINEDIELIAIKNRKYANWFRLLFEVIWIFGDELRYNERVYHGINCKLLFNKFEYDFKAPLSTTCDEQIAINFCKTSGIILELRNNESKAQPYFSMKHFSRYPESEYLFFGATLQITSIMIPDLKQSRFLNYEKQIQVLNFYMHIMNGNQIERYSLTKTKNKQQHIKKLKNLCKKTLKLIDNHIKVLNGDKSADLNDDYIWRLFVNFTKTNDIIWINKKEIRYLKERVITKNSANIKLADRFIVFGDDEKNGNNDEIGEYLKLLLINNSSMKILYAVEYEWVIKENELNKLKNGELSKENGIVCINYWDYYIDGDENNQNKRCTFGGNMISGFYDDTKQENEGKMVGFILRLSDIPDAYKSVIVSFELYCPEIEFYLQFFHIKMSRSENPTDGSQSTGHTNLFPLDRLNDLDTFKWRVIIKCSPVHNQ